jgi:hypothetical protein
MEITRAWVEKAADQPAYFVRADRQQHCNRRKGLPVMRFIE